MQNTSDSGIENYLLPLQGETTIQMYKIAGLYFWKNTEAGHIYQKINPM